MALTNFPLDHMLRNRMYLGELNHRDRSYPGEHAPIADRDPFEAVQARLTENLRQRRSGRSTSEALLQERLDGDRGNRMSPGRHGRNRSSVWTYPGINTFGAGRADALAMHPTVKPVALVADAMRDCTSKGDVVLDPFLGSGTTLMAAEKIGRRARGLEYEPTYVDVAIQRWEAFTRSDAILDVDGRTFGKIEEARLKAPPSIRPRSPTP